MIKKCSNKFIIAILGLVFITVITFVIIIATSKRSIIIYDNNGQEYYKITNKLEYVSHSEMIIRDNGVVDSIIKNIIDDLQLKYNYSEDKAIRILNKKDYKIYSTIDSNVQNSLNKDFNERSTFTQSKKAAYNESAMVIMDYDGNIVATTTTNNNDSTKNRTKDTLLQVGSTIKPLAIYAPAIERGIVNYSTIISDIPGNTYINGKAVSWPNNYDNKYESNVTITDALKKSKNTIAVNVGKMVGEEEIITFLKEKLGFSTLVDKEGEHTDKQLSALALGYFTEGITLDTLVAAYSIFGNGGSFNGKRYYTQVKDNKERVLLESDIKSIRAISEETATIMNRLLLNNITDKDSIIKNVAIGGVEVIGKTGSVGNDNEEITSQLFVGLTPDYIAGVWVGYDNERPLMQGQYNAPSQIWKSIMSKLQVDNHKFKLKDTVVEKEYCLTSGLIKTDNCEKTNSGYYHKDNLPAMCDKCN